MGSRLHAAGLVRSPAGVTIDLGRGLVAVRCRFRHDAGATFGFPVEGATAVRAPAGGRLRRGPRLLDNDLARSLSDVDLPPWKFNPRTSNLQRTSGRPQFLIRRVLSDTGMSIPGGELFGRGAGRIAAHPPRHVVPLQLSRDCNRPNGTVGRR